MAKIYLRIFVEALVEDLPGTSVAKKEFLGVLPHFSSYAVFAKTFGAKSGGGASSPAAADDETQGDAARPAHAASLAKGGGRGCCGGHRKFCRR